MRAGTWIARLVLSAYPPSIRRDHSSELASAIEASWADRVTAVSRARLLIRLIVDALMSWRRFRGGRPPAMARGQAGRPSPMSNFSGDVRAALRLFARMPLFALGTVFTLSVGIGATAAIVNLADATLLRPLPIRDPAHVWQLDIPWSYPDFQALEAAETPFSTVAAWSDQTFVLDRAGEPVEVSGDVVSGDYFSFVGVRALAGRLLVPDDDQPGAPPVAVLSERAWARLAGRDPAVVGATVLVNRQPITIVGIVPGQFRGLSLQADAPALFLPIHGMSVVGVGVLAHPSLHIVWLTVEGRLRPGASPAEAVSALSDLRQRIHPPHPGQPPEPVTMGPLIARALSLDGTGDGRRFVFVLVGATLVTLLLTCVTVCNLLLVRAERRRHELALRVALGAGRGRLMRLVLVESLAIGLAGSLGSLGVASLAVRCLGSFDLPGSVPIADLNLGLSPTVFLCSIALGVVTSLLFGLIPAWRASRPTMVSGLREGVRGTVSRPVSRALVTVQVGLCVVLLLGAFAFARAMQYALSFNLGFDTTTTALVSVDPARVRFPRARTADLEQRVEAALEEEPWVRGAGWVEFPPLGGSMTWTVGILANDGTMMRADLSSTEVSAGYFGAMGIPLRAGRRFAREDATGSAPVMIVSESMARRFWPGGHAVGARVLLDPDSPRPSPPVTVVGVVGDVRGAVNQEGMATFYTPLAQGPAAFDMGTQHLVVRAVVPPELAASNVVTLIKRLDPSLPVSSAVPMRNHLEAYLMPQRLGLALFLSFALLAAILTAFGIYAVVAFAVAQRTQEIGIRVALGAERETVLTLVVGEGLVSVGIGVVVGVLTFLVARSAIQSLTFALPTVTFGSLGLLALAVGAIGMGAMLVPIHRALSVDPVVALREN